MVGDEALIRDNNIIKLVSTIGVRDSNKNRVLSDQSELNATNTGKIINVLHSFGRSSVTPTYIILAGVSPILNLCASTRILLHRWISVRC